MNENTEEKKTIQVKNNNFSPKKNQRETQNFISHRSDIHQVTNFPDNNCSFGADFEPVTQNFNSKRRNSDFCNNKEKNMYSYTKKISRTSRNPSPTLSPPQKLSTPLILSPNKKGIMIMGKPSRDYPLEYREMTDYISSLEADLKKLTVKLTRNFGRIKHEKEQKEKYKAKSEFLEAE